MTQRPSIPLQQAAAAEPTLARLMALAQESGQRLAAVKKCIPPALHKLVAPGPIDGGEWCLLVPNSAAAAKLRQLLPSVLAEVQSRGWQVSAIRLKVQTISQS